MIRKYKCECGHIFEADDSSEVICPRDLSTNVKIYKPSPYKKYVIGTVMAIAAIAAILISLKCCTEGPGPGPISDSIPNTIADTILTLKYDSVVYHRQSNNFSFNAESNANQFYKDVKFELRHLDGDGVIADNSNGKFSDISETTEKDEGKYSLYLICDKKEKMSITVEGFIVPKGSIAKDPVRVGSPEPPFTSNKDLQEILLTDTVLNNTDDRFLDTIELIFKNLRKGENKPQSLDEVAEKISTGKWEGVIVTKFDCVKNNNCLKVSKIWLTIKYKQ